VAGLLGSRPTPTATVPQSLRAGWKELNTGSRGGDNSIPYQFIAVPLLRPVTRLCRKQCPQCGYTWKDIFYPDPCWKTFLQTRIRGHFEQTNQPAVLVNGRDGAQYGSERVKRLSGLLCAIDRGGTSGTRFLPVLLHNWWVSKQNKRHNHPATHLSAPPMARRPPPQRQLCPLLVWTGVDLHVNAGPEDGDR